MAEIQYYGKYFDFDAFFEKLRNHLNATGKDSWIEELNGVQSQLKQSVNLLSFVTLNNTQLDKTVQELTQLLKEKEEKIKQMVDKAEV